MFLCLIDDGIIDPKKEYYWKRTGSWDWFGTEHWWEVFVRFSNGMNGSGGACITEYWRWNGSSHTMRSQSRSLSPQETVELVESLEASGQIPNIRETLLALEAKG